LRETDSPIPGLKDIWEDFKEQLDDFEEEKLTFLDQWGSQTMERLASETGCLLEETTPLSQKKGRIWKFFKAILSDPDTGAIFTTDWGLDGPIEELSQGGIDRLRLRIEAGWSFKLGEPVEASTVEGSFQGVVNWVKSIRETLQAVK
jgi:hypothetical protein